MIIAGMTACEKTHYLLKMLEEEYKNHFDYIFIVCPTFEDNETYQNWEYLEDRDFRDSVRSRQSGRHAARHVCMYVCMYVCM